MDAVFSASSPAEALPPQDEALLHTLATSIVAAAHALPPDYCGALPFVLHARSDAGHARRIVLFQRPEHLHTRPCAFVGFIGKKRATIDHAMLDAVVAADERIMEDLIGHHDVLGYASLELPDRNWCNLVLFRRHEAVALLRDQAPHRYAAQELAPRFYQWIHLYHGNLPRGVAAHQDALTITRFHRYAYGGPDGDIHR